MDKAYLPQVQLCSASYCAYWIPGKVIVIAAGYHLTSGYKVFLDQSPLTVFPPAFILWHVAPTGSVSDVITPFTTSALFNSADPVEVVVINDANGPHTIKVETVPDMSALHSAASVRPSSALEEAGLEAFPVDENWSDRKGYQEGFLGIKIPLPQLSIAQKKNTVEVPAKYRRNNDPYILPYHHYSLAMNKRRRLAWFSAANIDGRNPVKLTRGSDHWSVDPRIEEDVRRPNNQMGEELYAGAKTDRGHLTRFLDVAWGKDQAEAKNAVADTFHFTNCSLQLAGFNEGKDRWQGLERFLLEQKARKEKRMMTVITGPVMLDDDPVYRNEHMTYSTRVPLRFWKICVLIRQDQTPASTAFILGQQDITNLKGFEEKFDVAAAQITVIELERLTRLKFGSIKKYDHFAKTRQPGTLEAVGATPIRGKIKPLQSFEDIVV